MARPKKKETRNPRVRIHKGNLTTLSGFHYKDLSSIFNAAALHFDDELRKARKNKADPDHIQWYVDQLKFLKVANLSLSAAIAATHPSFGPPTKKERLRRVKNDMFERKLLNELADSILKFGKTKSPHV